MMSDPLYKIPLPKEQRELLLNLVDHARKFNILSMMYVVHLPNEPPYTLYFLIDKDNRIQINLPEDPIPGYEVLGLIKITSENKIFLTPNLFKWADYERKSRLGKWWVRLPNAMKDGMIVFSFVVSLVLTIIQVLKAIQVLP